MALFRKKGVASTSGHGAAALPLAAKGSAVERRAALGANRSEPLCTRVARTDQRLAEGGITLEASDYSDPEERYSPGGRKRPLLFSLRSKGRSAGSYP
jgi:hypothetical protein